MCCSTGAGRGPWTFAAGSRDQGRSDGAIPSTGGRVEARRLRRRLESGDERDELRLVEKGHRLLARQPLPAALPPLFPTGQLDFDLQPEHGYPDRDERPIKPLPVAIGADRRRIDASFYAGFLRGLTRRRLRIAPAFHAPALRDHEALRLARGKEQELDRPGIDTAVGQRSYLCKRVATPRDLGCLLCLHPPAQFISRRTIIATAGSAFQPQQCTRT